METPARIITQPPPRDIPLSTRLIVLLGGMTSMFGWIFSGFGIMFAIIFVGSGDISSWIYFRGTVGTAPGIITSSEQTHASEGGSKGSRGTPIFAHHYKFSIDGNDSIGTSYCTGGGLLDHQQVTVEFPLDNPAISRIQGMRRAKFGPFVAFVLIFPLVGLTVVAVGLWSGRENIYLLANGEPAQARYLSQDATSMRVNGRTVYKVWFEFTDRSGALQKTFARTTTPEKLESRVFELLFYDTKQPSRSVLLHNLSGNVSLDERGDIMPCGFGKLISALWPLVLSAVFIGVGILLHQMI